MKSLVKVVVLSVCLLTAVSFAYAAGGRGIRDGKGTINAAGMTKPNYVDQNSDGVCDNLGNRNAGVGYGRGRGYGTGNRGSGSDKGMRFARFNKVPGQDAGYRAGFCPYGMR